MKYDDAVQEINRLGRLTQEHADTSTRALQTYQAQMTLFNVAASARDEKGMEAARDAMHSAVDTILDAGAMIADLKHKMWEVSNEAELPRSF